MISPAFGVQVGFTRVAEVSDSVRLRSVDDVT